jgi:DNA recombination protein RmuC
MNFTEMMPYLVLGTLVLLLVAIVLILTRTSQIRELGQQVERNWKKLDELQLRTDEVLRGANDIGNRAEDIQRRTGELAALTNEIENKTILIEAGVKENRSNADDNRNLILHNIRAQQDDIRAQQESMTSIEKQRMEALDRRMEGLEKRLGEINATTEQRLMKLQESNEAKLNEMRETVDEKLQKTLEDRLAASFKQVSDQLTEVYKGLGEMQNLATGVGDLKKVLSNVKTRGILGEIQLGAILEQILPPERYAENVATKPGSADRVEFAVCLPGEEDGKPVYLPIDAKFPLDLYANLRNAVDAGDLERTASARKALETRIKNEAKDIRDKYIDPPNTTEFGILFLPVEGLYAEVVQGGMVEVLQREYKVNIAGPSTMAAMLNSLQMGFKTLAIRKHTNEVWKVLGSVQKEFDNFGGVLAKTQERLRQADDELEKLVGVRTRKIQSTLKKVTKLEAGRYEAETIDANQLALTIDDAEDPADD